jgi:arylsulfatase A-like enzyme
LQKKRGEDVGSVFGFFSAITRKQWVFRSLRGFFLLHLLLTFTGLLAVGRWGSLSLEPGSEPNFGQIVLGNISILAVEGLLIWLAATLLFPLFRRPMWGTLCALVSLTLCMLMLLSFDVISFVVRALSGTYLTYGVWQFCASSSEHFLHILWSGYRGWLFGSLLVPVVMGIAFVHQVRWSWMPQAAYARWRWLALPFSLMVGWLGIKQAQAHPGVSNANPKLAMLLSFPTLHDASEPSTLKEQSVSVVPGPERSAEKVWQMVVRKHHGPKPNVLLITLESISANHVGFAGYDRDVTPNIDALARKGVWVNRVWTTATHSNYAQMAILSSLFPRRRNTLEMYRYLSYPRFLFHDLFHQLNYKTATISSQDESWQGMKRFEQTKTPVYFWNSPDFGGNHIDTGSEQVVPDESTVNQAISWIKKQSAQPWAMYINLQMTHFPYKIPDDAERPFQPEIPTGVFNFLYYSKEELPVVINHYDNALHYVDKQVGKLTHFLSEAGLLDNTLLVITSDHGEAFYEHGLVTHGKTLFEEESRVPLIFHWPKKLEAKQIDGNYSHLDILPSLSTLLELPLHPSFQGKSIFQKSTKGLQHPAVFFNIQGIRFEEGVVCYPWKLVFDQKGQSYRLFNLKSDPKEQHNVQDQFPNVFHTLQPILYSQMHEQMTYHDGDSKLFEKRFQPRLLGCPPNVVP